MVRIWCLPIGILDRQHLLGEHVELHVIVSVILKELKGVKAGFQNHPQTKRFKKHLGMLMDRHSQQVKEMEKRGYKHKSLLPDFSYTPEEYDYAWKEMILDLIRLDERDGIERK